MTTYENENADVLRIIESNAKALKYIVSPTLL